MPGHSFTFRKVARVSSGESAPGMGAGRLQRYRYHCVVCPGESIQQPLARWEHYEHGADIGVRGFGATKESAFEQAALALVAVIADPGCVELRERVSLSCEAPDDELLLAEWLNTIVYEMDSRRMLFGRFRVTIDDDHVAAEAWGEATDVARHHPAVEVKGATYTTLRVAREPNGTWVAQTVVDV